MNEEKIAHLGMLQNVIGRMANNLFLIKGWAVTLVATMAALSAKDSDLIFLNLAFFPVALFWLVDAYYLKLKRCYKELYYSVANAVFSGPAYLLDPKIFATRLCFLRAALSSSTIPFYLFMVLMILWFSLVRGNWHIKNFLI
jgi:hypothetical protein